jgi:hypothetical protein
MNYTFYHVIHIFSLFYFVGLLFAGFSNPSPEKKKFILRATGVAMLIAFVAGFGLVARTGGEWSGWVITKIVLWVILIGLPGLAFQNTSRIPALKWVARAAVLAAVILVSVKPF